MPIYCIDKLLSVLLADGFLTGAENMLNSASKCTASEIDASPEISRTAQQTHTPQKRKKKKSLDHKYVLVKTYSFAHHKQSLDQKWSQTCPQIILHICSASKKLPWLSDLWSDLTTILHENLHPEFLVVCFQWKIWGAEGEWGGGNNWLYLSQKEV